MCDSLQPNFNASLLDAMKDKASGTIWRVIRFHGEVVVREATDGELREWEYAHGGGFRKYSLSLSDWNRGDKLKFLPLDRAHNVALFIVVGVCEIKIFPPRYLCV